LFGISAKGRSGELGFRDASSWNHNVHYYELLLRSRSWPCSAALDVGCGDGTLVRLLAERAASVVGIDSSAAMIERARRVTADFNVELVHDDFLAHDFGRQRFDFISCVAALHHMEFTAALERMKSLLAPNGTVAVLGLAGSRTPADLALDAAGAVQSRLYRLRQPPRRDDDMPIAPPAEAYGEIARRAAEILPGARFRRLVLFRYLLTWTKPG
jgi:2-polyprenyl-3-methyl-5-hydroxy-6-metoxy-1,4-benzoquinol methylase